MSKRQFYRPLDGRGNTVELLRHNHAEETVTVRIVRGMFCPQNETHDFAADEFRLDYYLHEKI